MSFAISQILVLILDYLLKFMTIHFIFPKKISLTHYNGKVLLFGEYSVILNSPAFAIPVNNYFSEWRVSNTSNLSNESLKQVCDYLLERQEDFGQFLNFESFKSDLANGLYLHTNIPEGCGVGSSGALCAAVLDLFKTNMVIDLSYEDIRSFLAKMECYFHGTSSGLDPMVSYFNKPILFNSDKSLSLLTEINSFHPEIDVFLYDSGSTRRTDVLVKIFQEKLKDISFKQNVESDLIPLVGKLIDSWIDQRNDIMALLKEISNWQLLNMSEFIPEHVLAIWQQIADNQYISMKLCGAGGGGFFLVFAKKTISIPKNIQHQLIKISL